MKLNDLKDKLNDLKHKIDPKDKILKSINRKRAAVIGVIGISAICFGYALKKDNVENVVYGNVKSSTVVVKGEAKDSLMSVTLEQKDGSYLPCRVIEPNKLAPAFEKEYAKDRKENPSDLEKATGHWEDGRFYMKTLEINDRTFEFDTLPKREEYGRLTSITTLKDNPLITKLGFKSEDGSDFLCYVSELKVSLSDVNKEVVKDSKETKPDLEKITGFMYHGKFYIKTLDINDKTFKFYY